MAIFVTGTGTDVGKTLFCSMLLTKYGREFNLKYLKPIQTGTVQDSDIIKVKLLSQLHDSHFLPHEYHFAKPASPHYASELEFRSVDTIQLAEKYKKILEESIILEGAGGLFVPLNSTTLTIDVLKKVKFPTILVCHSGLGTINHTLLSIEALLTREIPLLGFYFIGEKNDISQNNIYTIESFSKVKFLGQSFIPDTIREGKTFLPFVDKYFDTNGVIKSLLK